MWRCDACNELREGKFCAECGNQLVAVVKWCPSCQVTYVNKSKFCTECGQKLEEKGNSRLVEVVEEVVKWCPICQVIYEHECKSVFCPECGHRLEEKGNSNASIPASEIKPNEVQNVGQVPDVGERMEVDKEVTDKPDIDVSMETEEESSISKVKEEPVMQDKDIEKPDSTKENEVASSMAKGKEEPLTENKVIEKPDIDVSKEAEYESSISKGKEEPITQDKVTDKPDSTKENEVVSSMAKVKEESSTENKVTDKPDSTKENEVVLSIAKVKEEPSTEDKVTEKPDIDVSMETEDESSISKVKGEPVMQDKLSKNEDMSRVDSKEIKTCSNDINAQPTHTSTAQIALTDESVPTPVESNEPVSTKPTLKYPSLLKINTNAFGDAKFMTIHFSITFHKDKINLQKDDKVFIYFGHQRLGNFEQPAVEMFHKMDLNKNLIAYAGDLTAPKSYFSTRIDYKYVVCNENGDRLWEYLYTPYSDNSLRNRLLIVNLQQRSVKDFYQVDDCFLPPAQHHSGATGLLKTVFRYQPKDQLKQFCTKNFPEILSLYLNNYSQKNAYQYALFLIGLHRGFFLSYTRHSGMQCEWKKVDGSCTKKLISYAVGELKSYVSTLRKAETENALNCMMLSLSMVFFMETVAVDCDQKVLSIIFESLSMEHINFEKNGDVFINVLNQQFPEESKSMIVNALSRFWKKGLLMQHVDFSASLWYPLVLIHAISGKCELFGKPTNKIVIDTDVNFESCGLPDCYQHTFKDTFLNAVFQNNNIAKIRNSIAIDQLLQRGITFLMIPNYYASVMQSGYFKYGLVLRMIHFHTSRHNKVENELSFLVESLLYLKPIFQREEISGDLHERLVRMDSLISLTSTSAKKYPINEDTSFYFELLIDCLEESYSSIEIYSSANQTNDGIGSVHKKLDKSLYSLYGSIGSCFQKVYWTNQSIQNLQKVLQIMSRFYELHVGDTSGDIKKKLSAMLYTKLGDLINEKFLEIYSSMDMQNYPKNIRTIFEDVCTNRLDSIAKDATESSYFSTLLLRKDGPYQILCTFFAKEWTKKKTNVDRIYHCVTWAPMKSFFDIFGKDFVSSRIEIDGPIWEALTFVNSIYAEIKNTSVSVEIIDRLDGRREIFCELVVAISPAKEKEKDKDKKKKEVISCIAVMCSQIVTFRSGLNVVQYLLDVCSVVPETICKLGRTRELVIRDVSSLAVGDVFDQKHGICVYFGLPQELLNVSYEIFRSKIGGIALFQESFMSSVKEAIAVDRELDYNLLLANIIKPALSELKQIIVHIVSGNIGRNEVIKKFGTTNIEKLADDFNTLTKYFKLTYTEANIKECVSKINCILSMESCQKTANKILKVAMHFKLDGNFNDMYNIIRLVEKNADIHLKDVSDNITSAVKELLCISPEIQKIFSAIESSLQLLLWLRDTLKVPKEVKVFVEMMSISAGETDYEVDRVACFEASCLAFGAIIFDLKEKSGFKELLTACKATEKILKEDVKIIDKLIDSNRNLEWFKDAKKSQGSVSTKSLMQAMEANKCGQYLVGNILENDQFLDKEVTLNDIIRLQVEWKDKKVRRRKQYSLDEIYDLQSRLMLLGGDVSNQPSDKQKEKDKQNEKDYFVKMSEITTTFAKLFVKLNDVGDVNYFYWFKKIACDINATKAIGMDEYFGILREEIADLEGHLKEGQKHISKFREKNIFINHLTVKQCLLLQKHLFPVTKDWKEVHKLPTQFFTLLKSIVNDVDVDMVKDAVNQSYLEDDSLKTNTWMKAESEKKSNFTESTYKQLQDYLNNLQKKYGIDENIALASLLKVYPYDEGHALIWCSKQDADSDSIETLSVEAEHKLENLKKKYEEYGMVEHAEEVQVIDTKSVFMPLEQLGKFLNALVENSEAKAKNNTVKPEIAMPTYLKKDKPSLIVLPQDEILSAVLHLYLHYDRGLPLSTDVLLCNDDVTMEQIELLIRRAAHDKTRLYCLVFVDQLGYELNDKTFTFIEKFQKKGAINNLVVFCCRENEHKSFLVSALNSSKIHMPAYYQKENVCELLKKQLLSSPPSKKNAELNYASDVDIEGYNTRVIASTCGGMGKSLFVSERVKELDELLSTSKNYKKKCKDKNTVIIIPVQGTCVDTSDIVQSLLKFEEKVDAVFPRIYHFDISPTVSEGLDCFLFNIVVLGCIQTRTGKVWRKNITDLCIIEVTNKEGLKNNLCVVTKMLPTYTCISPDESFKYIQKNPNPNQGATVVRKGINEKAFRGRQIQRVYQYLKRYDANPEELNTFVFQKNVIIEEHANCLQVLLKYCGVENPSWMELNNFVDFLNVQLIDSELSVYTNPLYNQDLRGFKAFVIKFLLEMSKDFATRSLTDSLGETREENNQIMVQLKRKWEQSSHPYLFFNQDHETLSFVGFNVTEEGDLIDLVDKKVIRPGIMSKELYEDLMRQMKMTTDEDNLKLDTDYNNLSRQQKLVLLCRVMGLENVFEPDQTYELTIDNITKMLAIHMRLRCGIPVILMGETGCGKTRLIRFMCALRSGTSDVQNMLLVKVHGGVTAKDILRRIEEAKILARKNRDEYKISTILFLDEANTTAGIDLIKEVMVDKRAVGTSLDLVNCGLELIAACNPYRRHTECMVKKLESAGLGYHVSAALTYEKIGDIPLRQLVYRVHQLPESMKPLVWDFGQLSAETEQAYARQIILRYERENKLPKNKAFVELIVYVLAASQVYMRAQKDECSFVSLRDVERAVQVSSWFYKKINFLLKIIRNKDLEESVADTKDKFTESLGKLRRSLVLALGVCYIARLEDRRSYMEYIAAFFTGKFKLKDGADQIRKEIICCQEAFVNQLNLEENIARNHALCENVFMMVICVELRIPLFVVGKPGSSKSLAKTIVQDNMQGTLSKSVLFKKFKQIFMQSYQCSPLSTADGIIGVFKQCSRFQEGKNLDQFTSVVVLDEVGLAEDSPSMPLKALHPLLEDGTDGSEELTADGAELKNKRCSFIGISNWSLDPAKMNRGIMLCRGSPDLKELVNTAKQICAGDQGIQGNILPLLKPLAESYMQIYEEQKNSPKLKKYKKEEFFGLRDFYSLIKMVFCFARKCHGQPSWLDIEHAVKRNFSGLEDVDTWANFKEKLRPFIKKKEKDLRSISTPELIQACFERNCACHEHVPNDDGMSAGGKRCHNVRYLLIMTEEYSALSIIQELFLDEKEDINIIFGSSFPKDQEFTQICRNINRIKMCMETGKTVVLLNMENLYESLYDALNQYYVYFGGQSYVDLGLGTHRVKCRVHENFKLIVIADRETVYRSFPIPLINRLEKHFLVTGTCMTKEQNESANIVKEWVNSFAIVESSRHKFGPADVFIGYNDDTCASMVMLMNQLGIVDQDQVMDACKRRLLNLATPDSLARLEKSKVGDETNELWDIYFEEQKHSSLFSFLEDYLLSDDSKPDCNFIQVTTFSRLLAPDDKEKLKIGDFQIQLMSLMQFQTEHMFQEAIKLFLESRQGGNSLLIIQCNHSAESLKLVTCAQHICKEAVRNQSENNSAIILFLLQLSHVQGRFKAISGTQSAWKCIHIDELRAPSREFPSLMLYAGQRMSAMFDYDQLTVKQLNYKKYFEVTNLIKGCIQAATKKLNEMKVMTKEKVSDMILTLSQLIAGEGNAEFNDHEDMPQRFVKVILKHFSECMRNKEEKMLEETSNWVQQEAIEQKHTPGYGTFREALIRCVEDRITDIFTALLCEMDRHSNLLILKNENYQALWIGLFETVLKDIPIENVTIVPQRKEEKFSAKFPFSAHISQILEDIIKTHGSQDPSPGNVAELGKVLDLLPVGAILKDVGYDAVKDYISDLVLSRFTCVSETAYKALTRGLLTAAKQTVSQLNSQQKRNQGIDGDEQEMPDFQLDILVVHCTLDVFEDRLEHTNALLRIKPGISSAVLAKIDDDDEEMLLDTITLRTILTMLYPSDKILSQQETEGFWLADIKNAKIVVKAQLSHAKKNDLSYGHKSRRMMDHCRLLWTRLHIIQMYLDIVSPPTMKASKFHKATVMELSKSLNNLDDDMRTIESWNVIERFLRLVIKESNNTKEKNRPEMPLHQQTERRCLTFFVELVSEFCFARDNFNEIDENVIHKIMGYAFKSKQTKSFSPLELAVDPTPVVRSFILQQLLKRKDIDVGQYVQRFLADHLQLAKTDKDRWEICKLFIHCCEDNISADSAILKVDINVYITHISRQLKNALEYLQRNVNTDIISVTLLENIALVRSSLISVSSILCTKYLPEVNELDNDLEKGIKNLIVALMKFIKLMKNNEGHMFFLRQIVHQHGSCELEKIVQNSGYKWLNLDLNQGNKPAEDQRDQYLVYKTPYKDLRDQISQVVLQQGNKNELNKLKEMTFPNAQSLIELAVLHDYYIPADEQVASLIVKEFSLKGVMDKVKAISNVIRDRKILEMLSHLMIVVKNNFNKANLNLIAYLITSPGNLQGCFLPAMPSDNFSEVSGIRPDRNTAFKFHQCRNGHPYVITECGRPTQRANCPECNAPIGGENHNLDRSNTRLQNRDTTEKGHCLGAANRRPEQAIPERDLPPLSVTLQRFLIHLSMLLGVTEGHQQNIGNLIRPKIPANQVLGFLVSHITHDIRVLGKSLAKSSDDTITAIHLLLKHLGGETTDNQQNNVRRRGFKQRVKDWTSGNIWGNALGNANTVLQNRDGRKTYETQFHRNVIEPFITSVHQGIRESKNLMLNDTRVASNPVIRRLYELDVKLPSSTENIEVASCHEFWVYRQPITLEDFKHEVQVAATASKGSHKTLTKFLQQEHIFTLISDLPGLLELQKILFSQYNIRLDKKSADEMPIKEALMQLPENLQKKSKQLVRTFIKLWKDLSPLLKEHGRLRPETKHHPEEIKMDTPLRYFLCSRNGPGCCAMGLIDLLAFRQNEFLEYCSSIFGFHTDSPQMSLLKVKTDDLITYKAEKDLLPIVVAFCDYSSKMGKGTEVPYNIESIERHFIEKIYFGRAHIVIQIQEFMYRDDVYSAKKFILLNASIKQTDIPHQERAKMVAELGEISDVSNALRAVEISIGFLTCTSGDPDLSYRKYISEVLHMNQEVFIASRKMQNTIRLTHVSSTWVMLTVERARRLHTTGQNPFFMERCFMAELNKNIKDQMKNEFRHMDTLTLTDLLTEYIVIELSLREDNAAELPLQEALEIYEDQRESALRVHGIDEMPDEVQLKHIYSFWKLIVDFNMTIQ